MPEVETIALGGPAPAQTDATPLSRLGQLASVRAVRPRLRRQGPPVAADPVRLLIVVATLDTVTPRLIGLPEADQVTLAMPL